MPKNPIDESSGQLSGGLDLSARITSRLVLAIEQGSGSFTLPDGTETSAFKYPDKEPISPDYTGIRTKLSGPGEAPVDFRIDGPAQDGAATRAKHPAARAGTEAALAAAVKGVARVLRVRFGRGVTRWIIRGPM